MTRFLPLFFLVLMLAGACGVSENSLPLALPHGYSTIHYGFTLLQTSEKYQIGDEFIVAPSIKSSWGLGGETELGIKTFGLGLAGEIKSEAYQDESWVFSYGAEGGFSFPMMNFLVTRLFPLNQEFLNLVSGAFYYGAGKIQGGWLHENLGIGLSLKAGYLDNAEFFPDMGVESKSRYAGKILFQPVLSFFLRETPKSFVFLSFEAGWILPLSLLYFSMGYAF